MWSTSKSKSKRRYFKNINTLLEVKFSTVAVLARKVPVPRGTKYQTFFLNLFENPDLLDENPDLLDENPDLTQVVPSCCQLLVFLKTCTCTCAKNFFFFLSSIVISNIFIFVLV